MMRPGAKIFLGLVLLCAVPAYAEPSVDPLENLNRKSHGFNDFADRIILRPVARGYHKIPDPIRRSAGNFYGNLADVGDMVNNVLQGKPGDGFRDLLRIAINTTLGIGGLFDPATELGLIDHNEDFGQTLAKWGVPTGPYLVIPFLGPSTLRNAFAGMVDIRLDPLIYYYPVAHRNTIIGMRIIHQRSELLAMESVVFGDRYLFFRDAYLQRREFLEQDGEVEDLFDADF